jgi:TIR domain
MPHDVFISHSSQNKLVADAVCAALESNGIRCWIAPRNAQPGRSFAREITRAIRRSKGTSFLIGSAGFCSIETLIRSQVDLERLGARPVDRVALIQSKLR